MDVVRMIGREQLTSKVFEEKHAIIVFHGRKGYGKNTFCSQYARKYGMRRITYNYEKKNLQKDAVSSFFVEKSDFVDVLVYLKGLDECKENVLIQLEDIQGMTKEQWKECYEIIRFINREKLKVRVCILIEKEIPSFLLPYIFNEKVYSVEECDLAFQKDEIGELLALRGIGDGKQGTLAGEIEKVCEGWPILVTAVLKYLEEHPPKKEIDWCEVVSKSLVGAYLEEHILSQLTKEQRKVFDVICWYQEASQEEIEVLLPEASLREVLMELVQKGFIQNQNKATYAIRNVFRFYDKVRISELKSREYQRRCIQHYMTYEQYEEALKIAELGGELKGIEEFLQQYGAMLLHKKMFDMCIDLSLFTLEKKKRLSVPIIHFISDLFLDLTPFMKEFNKDFNTDLNEREHYFYRNLLAIYDRPMECCEAVSQVLMEIKDKLQNARDKVESKDIMVKCFGCLQVVSQHSGKDIKWRTRKGAELFAYLQLQQGYGVERRVLLEKLWPDGMPNNAIIMLHNMIYHIRKEFAACGIADIIQYDKKSYRLDTSKVHSDLEDKLNLCRQVEKRDTETLLKEEKQFATYWGRYLEDIDGYWCVDLREYFDSSYIKGCMLIGQYYMEQQQYEKAVLFLKNANRVNNLLEEPISSLLKCYGKLGNQKMAKELYESYKHTIKLDLNIEPSANIRKVYEECKYMSVF